MYVIIKTEDSYNRAISNLKSSMTNRVAFDIETTGLVLKKDKIIGLAWTDNVSSGYYLPLLEWSSESQGLVPVWTKTQEMRLVSSLLSELLKKDLIMHNGVFDISMVWFAYGVDLTDALYSDTMLLKHTLMEERPFGLKEIGEILWGEGAIEEQTALKQEVQAVGGRWNQGQKDMYMATTETLGEYAVKDVILTMKIQKELTPKLKSSGLEKFFYVDEVMPLYKEATIPMKLGGLRVDVSYFEKLKVELDREIEEKMLKFYQKIEKDVEEKVDDILTKSIPVARQGKFAQKVLEFFECPIVTNKATGKPTFNQSAKNLLLKEYPDNVASKWLSGLVELDPSIEREIKKELYIEKNPSSPFVFNANSNQQLAWLLFDKYKLPVIKTSRETGDPSVGIETLEAYEHLDFLVPFAESKKLQKLNNTYVRAILEKNIDGWIAPGMLQTGTTSGRYSCRDPNFQNLPAKDTRIRHGIIAPQGYKLVVADESALEARIFSEVCGDPRLIDVWKEELDLYSRVAIDVFGLKGYSADPKDSNYLKEAAKSWRDKAKVFTLSVVYGSNAKRVADQLSIEYREAEELINKYLSTYSRLRDYMTDCEESACMTGQVSTQFGRIRRLPEAKEWYMKHDEGMTDRKYLQKIYGTKFGGELYYKFRNWMNLAKNHPIQGTAAHVMNAAMIETSRMIKDQKFDAWIALQVHDELVSVVRKDQAEAFAKCVKVCMEDNRITRQLQVPFITEPIICDRYSEGKD